MARRSTQEWEHIVASAMRQARDLFELESSPLAEEDCVRVLARARYPTRILGTGLAIRDLLAHAAETIAQDCGDRRFGRFCALYAVGTPIADIAGALGMSRAHLSKYWRPKAVKLITAQLRAELQERAA